MINSDRAKFWVSLLSKTRNRITLDFKSPSKPQAVYASAGKTGVRWVYAVKKDESWVELEIMLPGDDANSHNVYNHLYGHKSEIEKAFGEKIHWDKSDKRKTCRIQTTPRERYGSDNVDKWDDLQECLLRKMERMVNVFTPYIRQL